MQVSKSDREQEILFAKQAYGSYDALTTWPPYHHYLDMHISLTLLKFIFRIELFGPSFSLHPLPANDKVLCSMLLGRTGAPEFL